MILLAVIAFLALGLIVFAVLATTRSRAGTPKVGGPTPPPGGGPATTPPDGHGPAS
jgi:hypothetical protein